MPESEDQERDDEQIAELRAVVKQLSAMVRTVDLFGTGFVWTNPITGAERLLHPADVAVILPADQQTEIEKIKESARRAGYAEAVAYLRDHDRYRHWWHRPSADGENYWSERARAHLADYLETVGPDGPDVTRSNESGED